MKYPTKIDIKELVEYVAQFSDATRLYIGTDSERFKDGDGLWYADYISVVVVHKERRNGCKIFGCVKRERDYDSDKGRPIQRMMKETFHSCGLYREVFSAFEHRPDIALNMEIHLDINRMEEHGSSCAIDQAIGYVKGMCGIEPQVKPDAFSASYAADRWKEVICYTNAEDKKRAVA